MKHGILLCVLLLVACGDGPDDKAHNDERPAGGGHGHAPKMGGKLIDLNHVIQLELVHKFGSDTLTVYVWDGHVERAIRIKEPTIDFMLTAAGETLTITCMAQASKLSGEKVGSSSTFVAKTPELKGVRGLRGTLMRVKARGQEWEGVEFDLAKVEK